MLYFPPIDFRRTPVTLTVVAAALALAIITTLDRGANKTYFGMLQIGAYIWVGQFWRPLTTAVLHGDLFLHAFFNVYLLLFFGVALEGWIGSGRMAGLLVLLAYVSSLADYALGPLFAPLFGGFGRNVGLSGVVYGLFGIFWVGSRYRYYYAAYCPPQVVQWLMAWFVLCILLTSLGLFHIANIAHAAGLGFGLLIGMAMFDTRCRVQWTAAICAAAGTVLATLVTCPWHPSFQSVRDHGLWWVEAWF
jgi:membrane associated rhomboid family serine protease